MNRNETRELPASRASGRGGEGDAGAPQDSSSGPDSAPASSRFPIPDQHLSRRQAIGLAAAAVALPALDWTDAQAQRAAELVRTAPAAAQAAAPKFFTADEWETVRLLVDYIIPKDARSGSATDAQVPEFMDFMLNDDEASPSTRVAMRGGLAWLDADCRRRFTTGFVASSDAQRRAVLDDIAWPDRARPEMSHGVTFFNRFRDLTASGFFSSPIGYKDLDFRGNTFVADWTGCPPEALTKLGVRYGN
jgi:hypothetical protein